MTQYQLFTRSGVPKSTISNLVNCSYDSVKLRILHELCQGFQISLSDFSSPPSSTRIIWNHKKQEESNDSSCSYSCSFGRL